MHAHAHAVDLLLARPHCAVDSVTPAVLPCHVEAQGGRANQAGTEEDENARYSQDIAGLVLRAEEKGPCDVAGGVYNKHEGVGKGALCVAGHVLADNGEDEWPLSTLVSIQSSINKNREKRKTRKKNSITYRNSIRVD